MVEPVSDVSRLEEAAQNRMPPPDRTGLAWPPGKAIVLAAALIAGVAFAFNFTGGASTTRGSSPKAGAAIFHKTGALAARPAETTTTLAVAPVPTTSTTVVTVNALPVATAAPIVSTAPAVAPAVSEPSVAELVAEVEAAGVEPGSNWSWSVGDTSVHCGAMTGTGTGCTYGSNGLEYSVFSGSPTLALVAHELANAETQNDAVPSLLNEVAVAAAGSSWSPTDAVASCLVAHFMGIQDQSAGSWQCPSDLATVVATHIHDSL
jgi:hypothetical protein